jgi:Fe-S oxidoreductase
MNPGKIIDTPAFNDNLRLSPKISSLTPPTVLNWDEWGGIARAAEQCNGQGACLKDVGTMCPSFMVTKDEEHSTRGRANLLRQVLNQSLPPEELTGDRLHDAMDLCVECKACKNECPSAVDMALLKSEILALRHAKHGVPLRDRVFAGIAAGAKLNQLLGIRALTNYISRNPIAKVILDRFLGIHKSRPLPEFAEVSFVEWFRKNHSVGRPATKGSVVFFVDTFTNYFQPQVGKAAVKVLEALGYAVQITQQNECCGRPMISKGLLGDARDAAIKNLKSLEKFIEAGTPIVGVEPSCLLVFRDEYPLLLHNSTELTKLADTAAKQSFLIEEFITERAAEDENLVRDIFQGGADVSIHVHCHEKALVGTEQALKVLELANISANLIDSACCGMAGSFGFETEHYEISKAMAERTLVPAIHEMPKTDRLLITGTSCRQQLDHFASKTPIHLVEALAESLITR